MNFRQRVNNLTPVEPKASTWNIVFVERKIYVDLRVSGPLQRERDPGHIWEVPAHPRHPSGGARRRSVRQHARKFGFFPVSPGQVPELIDPVLRENKPRTLVFTHWKRAFWAFLRENWVCKFGHGRRKEFAQFALKDGFIFSLQYLCACWGHHLIRYSFLKVWDNVFSPTCAQIRIFSGNPPPPPRSGARIYRPSFRENKPRTLVFSLLSRKLGL